MRRNRRSALPGLPETTRPRYHAPLRALSALRQAHPAAARRCVPGVYSGTRPLLKGFLIVGRDRITALLPGREPESPAPRRRPKERAAGTGRRAGTSRPGGRDEPTAGGDDLAPASLRAGRPSWGPSRRWRRW